MIIDKTKTKEDVNSQVNDIKIFRPTFQQPNSIGDIYLATKRALKTIRENPDDENSEPFFKTIQIDTGQFEKLLGRRNIEGETVFPACFIRFVNIRYLVSQQRIGEGRAVMRVRFVLNRLNNGDPEFEIEPFAIFERVNMAIQDAKNTEPALQERCNLQYFDMPSSPTMLQPYWIDYDVWFRVSSAYQYRDWIESKIIAPPFTNFSDIPDSIEEDMDKPTYDEATNLRLATSPISQVNFVNDLIKLTIGESVLLSTQVHPDSSDLLDISFASSRPNIVAVSKNGVVIGLKPGSSRIRAYCNNGVEAFCSVYVL